MCVCVYNGLFTLKWKEGLTHATTWMKHEDITLREISSSPKDKTYDSMYMRFLEKPNSETQRMVVARGWEK